MVLLDETFTLMNGVGDPPVHWSCRSVIDIVSDKDVDSFEPGYGRRKRVHRGMDADARLKVTERYPESRGGRRSPKLVRDVERAEATAHPPSTFKSPEGIPKTVDPLSAERRVREAEALKKAIAEREAAREILTPEFKAMRKATRRTGKVNQKALDFFSTSDDIAEQVAALAEHFGKTVEQFFDDTIQAWKRYLGKAKVTVRISPKNLRQVLRDGRFKSQLETKSSSGLLNNKVRREAEAKLFGQIQYIDDAERAIYGYLDSETTVGFRSSANTQSYGQIKVRMKDAVKERSTFANVDSLMLPNSEFQSVSPILDPSPSSWWNRPGGIPGDITFSPEQLFAPEDIANPIYHEVQIHGGLFTDEIEEVLIPYKLGGIESLIEALEAKGISWRWFG